MYVSVCICVCGCVRVHVGPNVTPPSPNQWVRLPGQTEVDDVVFSQVPGPLLRCGLHALRFTSFILITNSCVNNPSFVLTLINC